MSQRNSRQKSPSPQVRRETRKRDSTPGRPACGEVPGPPPAAQTGAKTDPATNSSSSASELSVRQGRGHSDCWRSASSCGLHPRLRTDSKPEPVSSRREHQAPERPGCGGSQSSAARGPGTPGLPNTCTEPVTQGPAMVLRSQDLSSENANVKVKSWPQAPAQRPEAVAQFTFPHVYGLQS